MSDSTSKYAPTAWGQELYLDLTLPSGQLCQVRQPGMQPLIAAGVLESADTLTSLVDEKHIKRVAPKSASAQAKRKIASAPEVDTASMMRDPEQLQRVFKLVDKVTEYMVVQPDVKRPLKTISDVENPGQTIEVGIEHSERVDGVIYTDVIDLEDKMFIFQFSVGGSTDVESFRQQFAAGVGGVATQ